MMNESRLSYLIKAYLNKSATPEEREEFMELLDRSENDGTVKDLLTETWLQFQSHEQPFNDNEGEEMLNNILRKVPVVRPMDGSEGKRPVKWFRFAAAAAILFVTVAGIYTWFISRQPSTEVVKSNVREVKSDAIVPGGNKAVLILSDGSSIVLDSTYTGHLAKQGNAKVIQLNSATLAYKTGRESNQTVVYNTLATPNGGQYGLILPDGTKVWLNASSSIYYPTNFQGKERRVTITGEAYFEVARQVDMPFIITVKDLEVQVLGTHFNIMAYSDEPSVNTTLLEGSVKVSSGSLSKTLRPGQQSSVSEPGRIKIVDADVEEVIAWKNGWFQFNAFPLEKVMRQISRWYDVEVEYEGKMPGSHFTAMVSRGNNISQVLKIMEAGGVGFRIEGRKVVLYADHP